MMRRFTLKTVASAILGLFFGAQGVCVQAADWTGSTPSDANNNIVYLYNVGAKKFLGNGGRWGTQAVTTYEGTPFTLTYSNSKIILQSQVKGQGTSSNGYLAIMDGVSSVHDKLNYFTDRPKDDGYNRQITATQVTTSGSKIYRLTFTPTQNSGSTFYNKTYYMASAEDDIVTSLTSIDNDSANYSEWIIVTEEERKKAFKSAEDANAKAVNATFLMYDFDFARNNSACSYWKTGVSKDGTLSWSTSAVKKPIKTTDTYYLGNGYTEDDVETGKDPITGDTITAEKNRQCAYGADWTANIHGAEGYLTQTLESGNMLRSGYYRVSCKAFTTATTGKVRLWAAASSSDGNGSSDDQDNNVAYAYKTLPAITENIPTTYVEASRLINDANTTAYDASVVVYVDDVSKKQLTFGIYVNNADATAWTCFDSFALQYLGDPKHDLVLDEDQTSGDYIKAQATPDGETLKTSNLYLHRTMNAGKWNSLVLPVDLTVGQVKAAFGDQVRISQFDGATDETRPGTIIFKKINASRDNDTEIAIKAGELYLVKVDADKTMPTGLEAKKVTVDGEEKVNITSYYTITGVTFKTATDVANEDYTKKVESKEGAEIYGESQQIKFVGTYVKLGDQETEKIPANSYVLNGNNQGGTAGVWYFRTKTTPSKGFRGWLQRVNAQSEADLTYELDGVTETVKGSTTGIGEIVASPSAVSGNVYNLNGQLVRRNATSLEGLAAGVYVANGKKYVVK